MKRIKLDEDLGSKLVLVENGVEVDEIPEIPTEEDYLRSIKAEPTDDVIQCYFGSKELYESAQESGSPT